jgi:transcriptional regulator with XRE-family HTH domain
MIASQLKALRIKSGYKQEYVAMKIGIAQGHYANIERGHTAVSIEMLECFASFYGKGSVKEHLIKLFE